MSSDTDEMSKITFGKFNVTSQVCPIIIILLYFLLSLAFLTITTIVHLPFLTELPRSSTKPPNLSR